MNNLTRLSGLAAASILCATTQAQITNQDDCNDSGIDNVGPGVWNFDNSAATTGTQGQNEANCYEFGTTSIAKDIWFTYTATADTTVTIETCSVGHTNTDPKIAAWPGSPACPTDGSSLACNDDDCGQYSRIWFPVTNGTSYIIQVGNFPGAGGGTGVVTITEPGPPAAGCFTDLTSFLAACGSVIDSEDFSGFVADTPFDVSGGIPIGSGMNLEALNPIGFRNDVETPPFPPGQNNNGTNHASCFTDQDPPALEIEIDLGQSAGGFGCVVSQAIHMEMAEMQVWSGGALVQVCTVVSNSNTQFVGYLGTVDRIRWVSATLIPGVAGQTFGMDDIIVCDGIVSIGNNYCTPAVSNSSGLPAGIAATGSNLVTDNDLTLTAAQLPINFGYFLTSQTQGLFNPPGSDGTLCLGGDIGRFNASMYIIVGPTGSIDVDLTAVPQPAGLVAVQPGDVWNFQCWYRDSNPNLTSNFTDAVSVGFQ